MPKVEDSTAGVDVSHWKPKGEDVNIRIWDFGGHTIIHTVHRFFLSERCAYVVVCDGRTEGNNKLEYWLDFVKNYGDNSGVFILVNKKDEHLPTISINNLKEQYNIEGYHAFSIKKDSKALSDFCESLKAHIRDKPSWNASVIPRDAFRVKEKLEGLFAGDDRESITKKDFDRIAEKFQADDADELLKNLHALGVCLWYEGMEKFDTLVLNPEWISHGVYQVINWVHGQKKHSLKLKDFITVFENNASRFPKEKHEYLFSLMKAYDLAYETEDGGDLIIPHLLKEDRPERLPGFPLGESLMLRYRSDHPLPPDTISRFIVRHNREMMKRKTEEEDYPVWRYGILLEYGGNTALVREEDRTINVSVKGKDKTAYISRLRETLDDIFDGYKSTKPELEYRVQRFGKIPENVSPPLWLSGNRINNHVKRNKPYYDDETNQEIPLQQTVKIYNINGNIFWGGQGNKNTIDQSKTL